jgi:hypothetical protein
MNERRSSLHPKDTMSQKSGAVLANAGVVKPNGHQSRVLAQDAEKNECVKEQEQ